VVAWTVPTTGADERFAREQGVPLLSFEKGERKDDIAQQYLARFCGQEGILFVAKAQEKATGLSHREAA
jgi:hypothetical protein